jgi:hypothetical protein
MKMQRFAKCLPKPTAAYHGMQKLASSNADAHITSATKVAAASSRTVARKAAVLCGYLNSSQTSNRSTTSALMPAATASPRFGCISHTFCGGLRLLMTEPPPMNMRSAAFKLSKPMPTLRLREREGGCVFITHIVPYDSCVTVSLKNPRQP